MKKVYLSFLLGLIVFTYVSAQPDLQWIILNGQGKDGILSQGGTIVNQHTNTLNSNRFSIEGVQHPNRNCYAKTKNDIFIIYDNNEFFLSRTKYNNGYNPDFFYPRTQGSIGELVHNFNLPTGKKASYLYLANIYEGDDPPDQLKVNNTLSPTAQTYAFGTTSISQIPVFGITSLSQISSPNGIIATTHDVIKNSDITVILNGDALSNQDTLFVQLFDTLTKAFVSGVFFDTAQIFKTPVISSFSNASGVDFNGQYFTFNNLANPKPENVFINLRPNANCDPYFPGKYNQPYDSSARYVAVFTLKGTGKVKGVRNEYLMDSHDPNYTNVESICADQLGNQIVTYSIHFQNESFISASHLVVDFTLPDFFDTTCFAIREVHAGTSRATASYTRNGQHVTVTFNPEAQVTTCANEDTSNCTGWVTFCVRVNNPKVDLRKVSNNLALQNANVSFNNTKYSITEFYDKIKYDPPGPAFRVLEDIKCQCPCLKIDKKWKPKAPGN